MAGDHCEQAWSHFTCVRFEVSTDVMKGVWKNNEQIKKFNTLYYQPYVLTPCVRQRHLGVACVKMREYLRTLYGK